MNGLTDEEVVVSRKKYGSNNISVKKQNKLLNLIIESLGDPIIKIMLIALAIRFVLLFKDQNWYETLGMLISILLSSLISSLSEYGSNKSFERLQSEYENIKVRVRRNGKNETINNDDVVVDDIVLLTSGELIPADGILIEGSIGVDESSINGESKEVTKVLGQRVFKGSVVLSGSASIRIEKVGINTVYGSIAKGLTENNLPSPMRIRLTKLAKIISRIGYIGAILASISNIFNTVFISNNFDEAIIMSLITNPKYVVDLVIETVTLAVTIIIVCVPEGLPMMVALVLSSNMKRMLKNNVLVRKAVGIETSGSMNVLLTDKTGTLTKGKLSVIGICLPDDTHFNTLDDMKDDLKNIAYYYNKLGYSEFVPKSKDPKSISKKNERLIKKTYLRDVLKEPRLSIKKVHIYEYYDTYNGCIALRITDSYNRYDYYIYEEYIIDGVSFYDFHVASIRIYAPNKK